MALNKSNNSKLNLKIAPRDIFEQILEYMVIPTFDLVIEYGDQGIILCKRKISPYKNVWALPGLRLYKPESINEAIYRIAKNELGLTIHPQNKILLGQYMGRFRSEHNRQDLSTGYYISVSSDQEIKPNCEHFSKVQIVKEIPLNMGAMYRFYLDKYREMRMNEDSRKKKSKENRGQVLKLDLF